MVKVNHLKEGGLFINGIYESVLEEILVSIKKNPEETYYLQPYANKRIAALKKLQNGSTIKWILYASTTKNLNFVSYTAEIVNWEDKRDLSIERTRFVDSQLSQFQPNELKLDPANKDAKGINLISIKHLKKLEQPVPVQLFIKIKNGLPLKNRKQSGHWSYVRSFPEIGLFSLQYQGFVDKQFEDEVHKSLEDTEINRLDRLSKADKYPKFSSTVTRNYQRNADVVAQVHYRANGMCELCNKPAPFNKADGKPYLEVHHWIFLSEGGQDTIENAAALCPNCHKQAHFGADKEQIKLNHPVPKK